MEPNSNPQAFALRSGLEFSPQQYQGKTYVVVKDPVTARYFRFTHNQAAILDLLLTPTELPALADAVSEKLGAAVPVATLEAFLKSLEDKWLLDTPAVREKLVNIESQQLKDRNLLYWKLVSINPEKIFAWLLPRLGWVFTRGFHVFAASAILCGLVLSYLHWDQFMASLSKLFNLHGLVF